MPEAGSDNPTRPGALRPLAEAGVVAAVTAAIFLVIYRPWGSRFRVPFSYGHDSIFYAMVIRSLDLYGNYAHVPTLGAPFDQNLYDFPQGADRLHHVIWWGLGRFTDDAYLVLNLSYFLGFVLAAVSAFVVLRLLRIRPLLAGTVAVVFAYLPYHFWRGTQHPNLSAYFAVPLILLVAAWVLADGIPATPRALREWDRPRLIRRAAGLAGCALVLGSSAAYFAVFAVLTIAAAGVIAALQRWSLRPALGAAVASAAIGAVLVANVLPELRYRADQGENLETANRPAYESEVYGLHLAQVVVPDVNHQVAVLGKLGRRTANVPLPGEGGTYLGVFGVTGLAIALVSLFSGGRLPRRRDEAPDEAPLEHGFAAVALTGLLIATVGGFGYLLAVLGFQEIRVWGRYSVVLAFTCLAIAAIVAERLLDRFGPGRRWLGPVAAVVVLAVALFDQIPVNARPDYAAVDAVYQSDRGFYGDLESSLPEGAMVFQLPAMAFPESPGVNNVGSYDHLRGYVLGSNRLHWSAGGVSGRRADWQEAWAGEPAERMVDGLAAVGFRAIYVDTAGYTDGGTDLVTRLNDVLGFPDGVSGNQRMLWWDLEPTIDDLASRFDDDELAALRSAVLGSVEMLPGNGINGVESGPDGPFRWMGSSGDIEIRNPGDAHELRLRFTVEGPPGSTVSVSAPGADRTVTLDEAGRAEVDLRFDAANGRSHLTVATDAPRRIVAGDSRDLRVRLFGLAVTDPVLDRLLPTTS